MRGFKNFKGSDARCPSIHFLFYGISVGANLEKSYRANFEYFFVHTLFSQPFVFSLLTSQTFSSVFCKDLKNHPQNLVWSQRHTETNFQLFSTKIFGLEVKLKVGAIF